ncbi:pentatricopeptide repeat-containing protein At2g13600 [Cryptomeria japonica]|uniref:pentatricopeptide repeat-containing protein At2g13600 n=1 Tax=Cryptomeria japonica TaxID=3369 RepID=UPI0027DAAC4D|nr:pentatricopeptide repeat-containing protein At2g13600 [Cryptomeria japonica]
MAYFLHHSRLPALILIRQFIYHTPRNSIVSVSALEKGRIRKKPKSHSKSSAAVSVSSRESRLREAIDVLNVMDKQGIMINTETYASLIKLCTDMKALNEGKQVHTHMENSGINIPYSLETKLVSMYIKCASLEDARQVFDRMRKRTLYLWSSMIGGYSRQGIYEEVFNLYKQMLAKRLEPDRSVFVWVLKACSQQVGFLEQGKKVHNDAVRFGLESDVLVGNEVIDMYGKCGDLKNAHQVFDRMSERDAMSWTIIIGVCVRKGCAGESFELLRRMQAEGLRANLECLLTIIPLCANLGALTQGKEIHGYIVRGEFEENVSVGRVLVDMYAKCGNIRNARRLFGKMPQRDAVLWNVMVATCAQNGHHKEAQELFHQMQAEGIEPDLISWNSIIAVCVQNGEGGDALKLFCQMQQVSVRPNSITVASILPACAQLVALQQGKEIHAHIFRNGVKSDVAGTTALVDMYAKCGHLEYARRVFEKALGRDTITWNTMIGAYAMHGHGDKAFELFYEMQLAGVKPNNATFAGVLSACNHADMVDEAGYLFNSMDQEYQIKPDADHFASMVDLLSRAGRFNELNDLMKKKQIEPDASA